MAKNKEYRNGEDDITFNIISEETVTRLQKDGKVNVPKKKVSVPKDKQWNERLLASKLLQGIQNGDSVQKIANSFSEVITNNAVSAMRNARTMTTSAECHGRLDSYKDLAKQGVIMKKVWISTPDNRVRESHLAMDGEEVDIDKKFSNGCKFPGDAGGPPEEVWNCRCSIRSHLIGIKGKDGKVTYLSDRDETSHSKQIEAERERREKKTTTEHVVVQGKDISATWTRREDKFDFAIEDVINAQGFDGLPTVVSAEEFDKAVTEANNGNGFVAQRTYSATDKETLDEYRDMLYNGKWYVDCSEGGAQYGQGMYCAADYTGKITKGIQTEMAHYQELSEMKFNSEIRDWGGMRIAVRNKGTQIESYAYTETLTLTPDANIISYNKIRQMYNDERDYMLETLTEEEYMEWSNKQIGDLGVYAALKGYDAINAEGHGKSGSYTVILNRTKVIFKGE